MNHDELEQALSNANQLTHVLDGLEARSRAFGSALTGALKNAVTEGDGLSDILKNIGMRFSSVALDAGLAPLQQSLGTMFSGLTRSLSGVTAFANGGVVNSPTYFPLSGEAGLMGEAGAEAILPLRRGPDGRLGVATGGEGANRPSQIVFNVQATDADSFRRSESQINAMLTRAVYRGRRGV